MQLILGLHTSFDILYHFSTIDYSSLKNQGYEEKKYRFLADFSTDNAPASELILYMYLRVLGNLRVTANPKKYQVPLQF